MRNSLAIIRSLGKSGLRVIAGDETRFSTGMFSKYCSGRVVYPSTKNGEVFADHIFNVIKEEPYAAIFPVTDATVIPIVKHKKRFSKYTIVPYPDYSIMLKAIDKGATLKVAIENGVQCPKTFFIDGVDEIEAFTDELTYPLIIKPRMGYGSRGIAMCKSRDELASKFSSVTREFGPSLIQEYIPNGDALGVYTLFNFDSEPRAVCVQRRIRSYPASGGPSTYRETVKRPELVEIAFRLLKAIKWTGVAMVEFRVDPRDNTPKLMEINPRFWGSLQLSILSGVDYPYLLYKLAMEGDVKPVMDYRAGVRCRWLLPGDFLWYLSSPNKIRNLPAFVHRDNDDIISLRDPGPTLGFCLSAMRYMFDRNMWKFMIRKPIECR